MRLRALLLGALLAGFAQAATADINQLEIKADEATVPVIEVVGPHGDAYREVSTKSIDFYIWAHGEAPPNVPDNSRTFTIRGLEGNMLVEVYEGILYEVWKKYKVTLPYTDINVGGGYSHTPLAPIRRCNKLLQEATGEARADLLFNGGSVLVEQAYYFHANIVGDSRVGSRSTKASVLIKCLPLDHDPQRAKLRIEPTKVEKIGKFICPMELKLHGAVASREKFAGKAIFVGPHYLSAITNLNYTAAGNRNVNATYKINWSQSGGFTTAPNQEPKKQDLTFRFNVSDKNGKVVETAEERVQVSCRKIKSNAPVAGDEMTVKPAN
jgi:hypothetical protein